MEMQWCGEGEAEPEGGGAGDGGGGGRAWWWWTPCIAPQIAFGIRVFVFLGNHFGIREIRIHLLGLGGASAACGHTFLILRSSTY